MLLGPGMVDPIFQCELALELGMTLGEMGSRMSAHELAVVWPAYFEVRAEREEREERERERLSMRRGH